MVRIDDIRSCCMTVELVIMKFKPYLGLGIGIFLLLVGVVQGSESSSYRLEQITDIPPSRESSVASESSTMVDVAEDISVRTSDLMTQKQLQAWNDVGVMGQAIYVQKGKETVAHGIDAESSVILLNEQNGYESSTAVRVIEGTRYPYLLYAQVTAEPKTQQNDRILPTSCSNARPCTDSHASEWGADALGVGFAVRGQNAEPDMMKNDMYRSFVQNTVAYPVARSRGYTAQDSSYQVSIRVRPLKEQRTQSYWGRVRLILMPDF